MRLGAPFESAPPAELTDREIAWARALASARIEELVEARAAFLMVLWRHEADPSLWSGFDRLAEYAVDLRVPDAARLARELIQTLDTLSTVPMHSQRYRDALRARMR